MARSEIVAGGMLKREVGIFGATMMGIGSMVGTGVFVSIGLAAGYAGPAVVLTIALAAIVATCNALSSAQLASSMPVVTLSGLIGPALATWHRSTARKRAWRLQKSALSSRSLWRQCIGSLSGDRSFVAGLCCISAMKLL